MAWIDCDIDQVLDAGDHYIVLGRVRDLAVTDKASPLLFFRGRYGQFSSASLAARSVDVGRARPARAG